MKKNKNVIRLTESQFKQMITESVKRVLKEYSEKNSGPLMASFMSWMNRNGINCGYYCWDMDDDFEGVIKFGGVRINVPKYEVEVPKEEMLETIIERYYPFEYGGKTREIIQWFNNGASDVDIQEFVGIMNERAKDLYDEELGEWYEHKVECYDDAVNSRIDYERGK